MNEKYLETKDLLRKCFKLCNVVVYDGTDAFVAKFILRSEGYDKVDQESREKLDLEVNGNGEILKIDILHEVTFENIRAYGESSDEYDVIIYNRFKEMWF